MYFLVALIVLLMPAPLPAATDKNCLDCHQNHVTGAHAEVSCSACHGTFDEHHQAGVPSLIQHRCQACHEGTVGIFQGPMATRHKEKAFVERSWGKADPEFFQINCKGCHVQSCFDCHGFERQTHRLTRPATLSCHSCHRGYYVGADYYGYAPREDALRYQRGTDVQGEKYLKMRPDVHQRAGMACGDCHSMPSLAAGKSSAKHCRDCHTPDPKIIEHGIPAHMERLECYACHSGWGAQEYGTFFVRFTQSPFQEYFHVRTGNTAENYIRSAYLKRQDLPPLGINQRGLVSPIRPQFLAYFSDIKAEEVVGEENRLLAAEWKAFFPHTVQRGTPMCDACHNNPRRFLLESPEDRIYLPAADGLGLDSFWQQENQVMVNGSFYERQRFDRMSRRDSNYTKAYVEKWKQFLENVDDFSH